MLASPVNFYNVTAIFRRFLERLLGFTYWPWGKAAPKATQAEGKKESYSCRHFGGTGHLHSFSYRRGKSAAPDGKGAGRKTCGKFVGRAVSRRRESAESLREHWNGRVAWE